MTDLTNGLPAEQSPQHGVVFGDFDSIRFGLHLHERIAVTPEEREVVAVIPHRQGVVDLSNLLGNRVYNNRTITYVFYRFGVQQADVNVYQTTIENLLMRGFDQYLHDSFEPDFHYKGKCSEVIVEDEYAYRRIRIQVTFDLYPFKIANHMEAEDLFDLFNFDLDAFQDGLEFTFPFISGVRNEIVLYNAGKKTVHPTVGTTATNLWIRKDGITHTLRSGTHRYPRLHLTPGMNELEIWRSSSVSGTVRFDWQKELI